MANLKSLVKDTAIYGMSSIIARCINYLLVPLQTAKFAATGGQFGIITNVYSYVALLMVLLTYGMETTFFRFMSKEGENPDKVYATTLKTVGFTTTVFFLLVWIFQDTIATLTPYGNHPEYIVIMFTTVAVDAFVAIPFAYLRYIHRPVKFMVVRVVNIGMNILLNIAYFVVLPWLRINPFGLYDQSFHFDVVWVFYINLFCSLFTLLLFWKELRGLRHPFDKDTLKRMLSYTWPLLILGLAGQLNQNASSLLFPYFYDGTKQEAMSQLGIYGGCIKVAAIMLVITQAFRYAYEPFVFGKTKDTDNKDTYARAMKYYIIFTLLAFLCVIGYLDILRHIVARGYWEGLRVVPIVMAAEIMFGIFFNLSFWYKLTDRTLWGAWFSGLGVVILVLMDVWLIPHWGYMACAWAGFVSYGVSMLASYFVGQHYYPINYPLHDIAVYTLATVAIYLVMSCVNDLLTTYAALVVNTVLIGSFVFLIYIRDLRSLLQRRHTH